MARGNSEPVAILTWLMASVVPSAMTTTVPAVKELVAREAQVSSRSDPPSSVAAAVASVATDLVESVSRLTSPPTPIALLT